MLVPAYAATIHKSQGSEYPAVVIPVMTQHYAMLQWRATRKPQRGLRVRPAQDGAHIEPKLRYPGEWSGNRAIGSTSIRPKRKIELNREVLAGY